MIIEHRGRTFFVQTAKTGATIVYERKLSSPGGPTYLQFHHNVGIYSTANARPPSKLAREVLALAQKETAQ